MKRTLRALVLAGAVAWPAAASADSVADFGAALDACAGDDGAACADAVWSFVDVTGDGSLTAAELSRFLRVAGEWAVVEQTGLNAAAGGLGLGAEVDEQMGRTGAAAFAFLTGPFTARLILDNYDGNGMLDRGEVFADTDQRAFVQMVKTQMEQLPQYAAMAMAAAMAAQEQAGMGDDAGAANAAPEAQPDAMIVVPEPQAAEPMAAAEAPAAPRATFGLRGVDAIVMSDGGVDVFVVSGEIVNLSNGALAAPRAIAQVLDADRMVLMTWPLAPSRSMLGPGEAAAFIGRLVGAPAAATDWSVVLEGEE